MDSKDMIIWRYISINGILWLILFIFGAIILRKKYTKKDYATELINLIPGPKTYPLVGNAFQVAAKRREVVKNILGRFKQFGPIFRVWLGSKPIVTLSRAEQMEKILSSSKHIEKSIFYTQLECWLGDGLLLSKGAKWHSYRKLMTPTFHFKILENFLEVFNEKANLLVNKLSLESDNNKVFDVYPYISNATLDIICETAMGSNVNVQEKSDSVYVKSISEITELIAFRSRRLWLYSDWIFNITSYGKAFYKSLNILHNFTTQMIKERRLYRKIKSYSNTTTKLDDFEYEKKKTAFLDLLLDASDTGFNISETSIREEVDTFTFEGHDTTATGISWCLYLLGLHPECQEKVYQELNDIFENEERPITFNELGQMKYLERVIKETLRLFPPVPMIGRVLEEEVKIDGYTIPAGVNMGLFIYQLHRDPKYFPDPEKFDPDRFLPELCIERHPYAYIPFSAGNRNCIGQKFAMMEEKIILAKILRKYKFTSVDQREDMTVLFELVLRSADGFKMKFASR